MENGLLWDHPAEKDLEKYKMLLYAKKWGGGQSPRAH